MTCSPQISMWINANVIFYRWFSRYVIAAMVVDGKQKIAH